MTTRRSTTTRDQRGTNSEGIDSVTDASDEGTNEATTTASRQTDLERVASSTYTQTLSADITRGDFNNSAGRTESPNEKTTPNGGTSSTNTYDTFTEMAETQSADGERSDEGHTTESDDLHVDESGEPTDTDRSYLIHDQHPSNVSPGEMA